MSVLTPEMIQTMYPELKDAEILVAVSGGVDSMVLCSLLLEGGIKFSIAHCNFQLRGKESDADEEFIEKFCSVSKIQLFVKKFDVGKFKESGNYSTQMAARELRYAWFDELMKVHGFDFLLTAHHLNDNIETFFINLSRGTGIKGLSAIRERNGYILRPLLSFSKNELLDYANMHELGWREDSSNESDDYLRNKIRHHLVPELEKLHSDFYRNFKDTIGNLRSDAEMLEASVNKLKSELFEEKNGIIRVSIEKLKELQPLDGFLHHLFFEFGFRYPGEIIKLIFAKSNGEINSSEYRLIKNRDELLLTRTSEKKLTKVYELINGECTKKSVNLKIVTSGLQDPSAIESLDAENIRFPVLLRQKKEGDIFAPLGMKGTKKLSKFLKDEKLSKLEKENVWLLTDSEDNILYIIGKRISEKYKVKKDTQKFLNIYLC